MLSRHAGNTEQIRPCSIAGRNLTRPSAWNASDPVGIDRARSRKLKKENERLKKVIAEKELEVALLQDAYKKNEEERSLIADYRSRGVECIKDPDAPEDSKEHALLFSAIFADQERAEGLHDH